MTTLAIALYCLVSPVAFVALVAGAGFVGRRLASEEFSWARYGGWLAGTLVLAVLVIAARTWLVFLGMSVALVVWVLLRAAADAQSTTIREKLGFLQLYAGLCLVETLTLGRVGALDGTRASAPFAFALHDDLGHLLFPLISAIAPGSAVPGAIAQVLASSLAEHWLLAAALGTFGVAALAYAHFAEHAIPKVGLSLLPAPTVGSALLAGLAAARVGLPEGDPRGVAAGLGVLFLAPYFVAEGIWVLRLLARPLATRGGWALSLAALAIVLPSLATALATVGWLFHLVRLRAFVPVLGEVSRSAARPRLRAALVGSAGVSLAVAALGGAEAALLHRVSPALGDAPAVCSSVRVVPAGDLVRVERTSGAFSIEREERPVPAATLTDAEAACAAVGARLCTSDEWALACLCSYPNESVGGPKLRVNERLVFRTRAERAGETPEEHRPVIRGLLSGATEWVGPALPGGGALLAGPADPVDDPWSADCRYRAFVGAGAPAAEGWAFTAARCCR